MPTILAGPCSHQSKGLDDVCSLPTVRIIGIYGNTGGPWSAALTAAGLVAALPSGGRNGYQDPPGGRQCDVWTSSMTRATLHRGKALMYLCDRDGCCKLQPLLPLLPLPTQPRCFPTPHSADSCCRQSHQDPHRPRRCTLMKRHHRHYHPHQSYHPRHRPAPYLASRPRHWHLNTLRPVPLN